MSIFSSIFPKKSKDVDFPPVLDYSAIAVDIHSHLIPGIDDGVKTMEESIDMIRAFSELGYKKLVTTPHVMSDYFKNTPEIILGGLEKVREAVKQNGIDIQVDAAAEYYLDENFLKKLHNEKMLTINGTYLLFEISYINPPDNLYKVIFDISTSGYTPILAHPERYDFWHDRFEEYRKIRENGALLQLNVNSLNGYYGHGAKRTAEKLVDENLIDFIGSDLHGARHMDSLFYTLNEKYFWKLVNQGVKNNTLLSTFQ